MQEEWAEKHADLNWIIENKIKNNDFGIKSTFEETLDDKPDDYVDPEEDGLVVDDYTDDFIKKSSMNQNDLNAFIYNANFHND